jgi:hypothetical protein
MHPNICGSKFKRYALPTRVPTRFLSLVRLACVVLACTLAAQTFALPLIAPNELVGGTTQTQLARKYVEWAEAQPYSYTTDVLVNTQNASPVAFLPSTYLPTASYSITVNAGTPLFLPITYGPFWLDDDQSTDGAPCDTAADRFACHQGQLKLFMDNPTQLILKVDSEVIPISDAHRFTSNGVPSIVLLHATNVFGLGEVSRNILFDGWFAALTALSPGEHNIEYGFVYPDFSVLQTAAINVVPAPGIFLLLLVGAVVMGEMRARVRYEKKSLAQE